MSSSPNFQHIFSTQVGYSKSYQTNEKPLTKGRGYGHMTHLNSQSPLKYLQNGYSERFQILYTGSPCNVLALGLRDVFKFWKISDNNSKAV